MISVSTGQKSRHAISYYVSAQKAPIPVNDLDNLLKCPTPSVGHLHVYHEPRQFETTISSDIYLIDYINLMQWLIAVSVS